MKHEQKTCPRCGAAFECKVNNPVHCQCAGIDLSERLLDRLAATWSDCLCAACLRHLAAADRAVDEVADSSRARQPGTSTGA
ncbi:MAG: hypothetical protein EA400_17190 [Chromatiaceae bacterium]|nr:MAG: hypothetical protein EA400_17190 [Chromatiaceae bacterium]